MKFYQKIEDIEGNTEISVFADGDRSGHLTQLLFKDESQLPIGGLHIDDYLVQKGDSNTETQQLFNDDKDNWQEINFQAYQSVVNQFMAFKTRYNEKHNGI